MPGRTDTFDGTELQCRSGGALQSLSGLQRNVFAQLVGGGTEGRPCRERHMLTGLVGGADVSLVGDDDVPIVGAKNEVLPVAAATNKSACICLVFGACREICLPPGIPIVFERLYGPVQCGDANRVGDLGEHPFEHTIVSAPGQDTRSDHPLARHDVEIDMMTSVIRKLCDKRSLRSAVAIPEWMETIDLGKEGRSLGGEGVTIKTPKVVLSPKVLKQALCESLQVLRCYERVEGCVWAL